jgi:uncharacterized protein (DUF2384 family)
MVFENEEQFIKWIFSEIRSMSFRTPFELLSQGKVTEVIDTLFRIEYGIC